jgi:glycosyltransferase involved in cell wall biosynthesis
MGETPMLFFARLKMPTETPPASKIAIVIPVYNGAEYLERAIQSAINQTLPAAEIVITDDASADATASVIEKYLSHPLVRVQRLAERVIAPVAWNKAIRSSTAPYFVILAHDDLLLPTFIADAENALAKAPETGLVVTGYRVIDETDRVTAERPLPHAQLTGKTTFADFFAELVVGGGMYFCDTGSVIARSAFEKINGFDERFKGGVYDFDFYLRLAAATPVFGIKPCLADYRVHGSNMSADLHRDDKGDGDVLFLKLGEYTQFTIDQKRLLVRNISNFQFQHYTRAVRSTKLSAEEIRAARALVAARLEHWARSGTPYAPFVLQWPARISGRIAWILGASGLGIVLLRFLIKNLGGKQSRWS